MQVRKWRDRVVSCSEEFAAVTVDFRNDTERIDFWFAYLNRGWPQQTFSEFYQNGWKGRPKWGQVRRSA